MIGKVFFSGEFLPTVCALVGSFARMQSDVVRKMFLPGEGFATVRAAVGRFAGVLAHVVCEVFLPGKTFGAVAALEWRFALRKITDVVQFTITVTRAGRRGIGSRRWH